MPDQEQKYEPGTFPGNDGRVVTTDPTHGRIPADIQWEVEHVYRPRTTGDRVAIENSVFGARAKRAAKVPARERTLETARSLITGQRQEDYGTPQESFGRIAAIWSALLGVEVSAGQEVTTTDTQYVVVCDECREPVEWFDGFDALSGLLAYAARDDHNASHLPPFARDVCLSR